MGLSMMNLILISKIFGCDLKKNYRNKMGKMVKTLGSFFRRKNKYENDIFIHTNLFLLKYYYFKVEK